MSPAKSHININGSRPSPLRIAKDSHLINKPSVANLPSQDAKQHKQRQPVIIYAHSPKIIHTKPHDFMALVQKLTGCNSGSDDFDDNKNKSFQIKTESNIVRSLEDNNDSSSGITDDDRAVGNSSNSGGAVSPCFADMPPLFTPNSMSFFCSPRPAFRFPDSAFASPNTMSNLITPSAFDFLKGLPEC